MKTGRAETTLQSVVYAFANGNVKGAPAGSTGWSVSLVQETDGNVLKDLGTYWGTSGTRERAELMAVVRALETIARSIGPRIVRVFLDSDFVRSGLGRNGRTRRADLLEMWNRLDKAIAEHEHVAMIHANERMMWPNERPAGRRT